jgi:hypothetical protein
VQEEGIMLAEGRIVVFYRFGALTIVALKLRKKGGKGRNQSISSRTCYRSGFKLTPSDGP